MPKLEYKINNKVLESWHFVNITLCNWKKKELLKSGTHKTGKLVITNKN